MKKHLLMIFVLVIGITLLISACSSAPASSSRPAAPASFANKTNPYAGNADAIAKGKTEYNTNCLSCHGVTGAGDGPASSALTPKPTNLVTALKEVTPGYFYWRISDGGGMEPFKSSMPAFKALLTEEKIWQVVSYIQTLK